MKALLAIAVLALCGCTTTAQTALTGYEATALKGIQASNDNLVQVWKTAACGTPLSAILRNPEVIPALKALCLPGGDAANPTGLLDGKTPITVNLVVPPAKPASTP
jgi:hypothetical protein